MPKQVLLLRVPTPEGGRLELLREDGSRLCTLDLEPRAPNIAVVTLPSAAARAPGVIMYRGGDVHGPPAPPPPAEEFGPPVPTAGGDPA
jgi:hypothetical protein